MMTDMLPNTQPALPYFRRMVKAIGDHVRPEETAYRYEILEFKPNGSFLRREAVLIDQTQMRADKVRLYEVAESDGWALITKEEFQMLKASWDTLRARLGYTPIDEFGQGLQQFA